MLEKVEKPCTKVTSEFYSNVFTGACMNLDFYLLHGGYFKNSLPWYLVFRANVKVLHFIPPLSKVAI